MFTLVIVLYIGVPMLNDGYASFEKCNAVGVEMIKESPNIIEDFYCVEN